MNRAWMSEDELGYAVGTMFRVECRTEEEIADEFDIGVADVVDILRKNETARRVNSSHEFRVMVARDFHYSGGVRKARLIADRYYVSDCSVREWASRYPRNDVAAVDGRREDRVDDLKKEVRELRDIVMKLAARVDIKNY